MLTAPNHVQMNDELLSHEIDCYTYDVEFPARSTGTRYVLNKLGAWHEAFASTAQTSDVPREMLCEYLD